MLQLTSLLAAAAGCCFLLVAVVVSKALLFISKWQAMKRKYSTSSIPGPPASKHVMGHVPDFMGPKGPWTVLYWANAFGPVFKMQFMDSFAIVLTDHESIMRVTRKTSSGPLLPKPHFLYQALENGTKPKVPSILTSPDGDYWKAVRQAAAPCFSMSNLKQVVPLVLELTQRAADHMSQHDSCDITDAAKRITSDVMGHLLYGEDLRGTHWEASEYFEVFYASTKAQAGMFNNPFYLWQLWDPEIRQQRRALARHNELIGEKVKRLRETPPAAHTIAAHLLSAIDPATGQPLNDHQVKAEIGTFMAAGFETTSHAIGWTLTLLASHPEVQQDVLAELQEAGLAATTYGSSSGRDFTASDLNRLPLLSAVIKESLRLVPPAPFGGIRYVAMEEGIELCGHHVPKGTLVIIPLLPYGLAKHTYGPDTLQFKPQRWMSKDGERSGSLEPAAAEAEAAVAETASAHDATADAVSKAPLVAPQANVADAVATVPRAAAAAPPDPLTFFTGTRDCIGQNLAKLELQVVLATLLSRFRFSPGPELEQELQVAAATGQPVATAVHALAGAYISLQPLSGQMVLRISTRE